MMSKSEEVFELSEAATEALSLYYEAIARKIADMPEFENMCKDELDKVLQAFDPKIRLHVEKMQNSTAFEYMEWAKNQ